MSRDPEELTGRLGYRFGSPDLLTDALTHRSADRRHNERLEFLGDAVLGLIMAEELLRRRPDSSEGDLSRLRALLVNGETLADVAHEVELGSYLNLGSGEMKSGGRQRASIIADALEALLGAIYLDGGLAVTRDVILHLYSGRLDALPDPETLKDPKTRLQEHLQGRGLSRPTYESVSETGEPHRKTFTVRCHVRELAIAAEASGSSRRKAEQAAAQQVLERLADE